MKVRSGIGASVIGAGWAGVLAIAVGAGGAWAGDCPAQCDGDIDGNGEVDGADLGLLLGAWDTGDTCANLSGDGNVDGNDLGILLGAWGPCVVGPCGSGAGDCCVPNGTPGCDDVACCDAVCAIDPFCCDTEWDGICAGEAVDLCGLCVQPTGACCFPDGSCADGLTQRACEGPGKGLGGDGVYQGDGTLCADVECPQPCGEGAGDCCTANGTVGCDDVTCCEAVCAIDPFCCDTSWDGICADEALDLCEVCDKGLGCPGDGDCCVANGTPDCDDAVCCVTVCVADPFCCKVDWDDLCAEQASRLCEGCTPQDPCPGDGDCCVDNGTPACDDATCCAAVCVVDPFCCDIAWDGICADEAADLCAGCGGAGCAGEGSCCEANGTPSCDDAECCTVVCRDDPFCCDVTWDLLCADAAGTLCPACGGGGKSPCPGDGDCCVDNGTPGCDEATCCEAVCAKDTFCCEVAWDGVCAEIAAALCKACPGAADCPGSGGDCCGPNGTPGCDDVECCSEVCAVDVFCCEVAWDGSCAEAAVRVCAVCTPICGGDAGDCCSANGTPGCDDVACCDAVCADDPFCCEVEWDSICANAASTLCEGCDVTGACCFPDGTCADGLTIGECETEGKGGGGGSWQGPGSTCGDVDCPQPCGKGAGDCCTANGTVGCDDVACCDAVCAIDPFCCNIAWDGICADEAIRLCAVCSAGSCPGDGGDCCVANGTPGCDDEACCTSVCAIDAFCCETEWDELCAGEALDLCKGCAGGCPGVCLGDLDGNGSIDGADLGLLLGSWCAGTFCDPCADLNKDGAVDGADLGLLLGGWGLCPD